RRMRQSYSGWLRSRATNGRWSALAVPNRRSLLKILLAVDLIIAPAVYCCALLLRFVRRVGVKRLPCSKAMLLRAGAFPVRDYYYEPAFRNEAIRELLST